MIDSNSSPNKVNIEIRMKTYSRMEVEQAKKISRHLPSRVAMRG